MDNYANAHRQHYANKVKESGVDLNSLLSNLEKKFPDFLFTISDGYSVLFERKTPKITSGDMGNSTYGITNDFVFVSNTQSDLSPSTLFHRASFTSTTIPLSFTKNKNIDCALIGWSGVEFGTSSIKSTATGVVAGGCSANGDLINSTLLASTGVTSIKLKLNFYMEVNGYAVGVVGSSVTGSNSSTKAKIDGQNEYFIREYISKMAFAPVLWVASFNQSKSFTFNPDLTAYKGKTLKINGYTSSSAMSAICCATSSSGRVSITSASLTITN